jgi:hypothetical protein
MILCGKIWSLKNIFDQKILVTRKLFFDRKISHKKFFHQKNLVMKKLFQSNNFNFEQKQFLQRNILEMIDAKVLIIKNNDENILASH